MRTGFSHHQMGSLEFLTIPAFDDTGLVDHCFTTRLGGVSTGELSTLNLGIYKNDTTENVIRNYQLITQPVGIDYTKLTFSRQVHGDQIGIITKESAPRNGIFKSALEGLDALITGDPQVPLATYHADCVPLFFLDPVKRVTALAHSGWRGTVKKIGMKTIEKMVSEYGCDTKDLLVAIGPSIGPCHFEVDGPVASQFVEAYGYDSDSIVRENKKGKYTIDLWKANILQFEQLGVLDSNITLAGECTYCNRHKYFSHRGDSGKTGSLAAMIQLRL